MLRSLCAVVVLLVSGRVVCAAVSLCPCRISIVPPLLDRFGLFCVLRCFELCVLLCCGFCGFFVSCRASIDLLLLLRCFVLCCSLICLSSVVCALLSWLS